MDHQHKHMPTKHDNEQQKLKESSGFHLDHEMVSFQGVLQQRRVGGQVYNTIKCV